MFNHGPDPEEKPVPPDELAELEKFNQVIKEKQEAWRKLLDNLVDLTKKNNETQDTGNENPTA